MKQDVSIQNETSNQETKISISNLKPSPSQPRRLFDKNSINELAESIKSKGLVQPILVRPSPTDTGTYEIIAGERRWRAAQIAQLHEIPAVVRKLDDVEIICLPSQHWSKRSAFKSFDTLWSSWLLKIGNFKFWFAGDTGYNTIQFKQIGDDYGPFDLSAIPIGAYEPRWFMKSFHVNPEEAIFIHEDIKSEKSIGMHFGTFVLTTEPVVEPIEKIKNFIKNDENLEGEFMIPESGVIYSLDRK